MQEDRLEFTVSIKADEATLQDIYTTFVGYPAMFDKLALVLKHTLEGVILNKEFEVELKHNLHLEHLTEPVQWR